MLKRIKNAVPNTITCLNLISGAIACILSFHYDEQLGALKAYEWAFLFIGAAAVFDFCDGASARLLGAYSAMGKELDSLADEISFGLAPSMLMFNTINYYNGASLSAWAFIALFIPAMGGAASGQIQYRRPPDHIVHRPADTGMRHILDRNHRMDQQPHLSRQHSHDGNYSGNVADDGEQSPNVLS